MAQTFEQFITKERERLTKERTDAQDALKAAQDKVDAIEWEFARIEAYEKTPKPGQKPKAAPAAKGTRGPSGKRGELGGKRKEVYDYITAHPKGLFANEVIKHFTPSGDEKIKSAVNAALFNLKKQGRISQSEPRAQYVAVGTTDQPEAAATDEEAA